jgi:hypothetical protein
VIDALLDTSPGIACCRFTAWTRLYSVCSSVSDGVISFPEVMDSKSGND